MTANLLDCPTYKIEDRREILDRVLRALQDDPNCYHAVRGGWRRLTPDEAANWDARESITGLRSTFKVASDEPPVVEIEPAQDKPADESTEV